MRRRPGGVGWLADWEVVLLLGCHTQEGVKRGLRFKVGMAALPHPFKRPDGVGANLR